MTRRMWTWTAVFGVLGGVLLGLGIRARVDWHPPRNSQLVLTMGQLVGMVVGASLLVLALLVLGAGARRYRDAKRRQRLLDRG